ncbi:HU family DNA-binding protein [Patulibacter sp. NPDC049589]|uniref:HU family DNA-binding protein n=1 Tax=Patulibacter sp. NPDC049589 TaxID=3154731 RepID=UPI00343700C5
MVGSRHVVVTGFSRFCTRERAARRARDCVTGEVIQIGARATKKFAAARALRREFTRSSPVPSQRNGTGCGAWVLSFGVNLLRGVGQRHQDTTPTRDESYEAAAFRALGRFGHRSSYFPGGPYRTRGRSDAGPGKLELLAGGPTADAGNPERHDPERFVARQHTDLRADGRPVPPADRGLPDQERPGVGL